MAGTPFAEGAPYTPHTDGVPYFHGDQIVSDFRILSRGWAATSASIPITALTSTSISTSASTSTTSTSVSSSSSCSSSLQRKYINENYRTPTIFSTKLSARLQTKTWSYKRQHNTSGLATKKLIKNLSPISYFAFVYFACTIWPWELNKSTWNYAARLSVEM